MLKAASQALTLKRAGHVVGRHCFSCAHFLAEVAIGLLVLVLVAAGGLAVRLSHGPMMVDGLVRPFIATINRQSPTQLSVGHTMLAWAGWQKSDAPVQLRIQQVELYQLENGHAVTLARLPDASMTLSLARLLIGELRPRSITLAGPVLHVTRAPDGSFALDLGDLVAPTASATPFAELVALGLLGVSADLNRPGAFLAELRQVRIRGARIAVTDQQLGSDWSMANADLDFIRHPAAWHGTTSLPLRAGDSRLKLNVTADVAPDGSSQISLDTSTVRPADLARAMPALATLAVLEAPLSLKLTAELNPALVPISWQLDATLGTGDIAVADGLLPVANGTLMLSGVGDQTRITALGLDLPAARGARVSHLTGSGIFNRDPTAVRGALHLAVDQVGFADLPELWPFGVVGSARDWVTTHISGGVARNIHVDLALRARPDFKGFTLASVTGGCEAEDLTLAWVLHVPPLTHGRATVTLQDRNDIAIAIHGAQQGAMAVSGGSFDMNGLGTPNPRGTLAADGSGALPDLLTLVATPALHLLDRHPLGFKDPSGSFTGHLGLALPLRTLKQNEIIFAANLAATDVHLGDIAARHDLDHAALAITVNNAGLTAAGRGEIAHVAGDLSSMVNFRAQDPLAERTSFTAVATPAQIAAAGYDPLKLLDGGQIGLSVTYQQSRGGAGTALIDADLTRASLAPELGWHKDIGTAGHASGTLTIRDRAITDVPSFTASAPGMTVAGRIAVAGGAIQAVSLRRLQLGRSDFAADIGFPAAAGAAYQLRLAGAAIDLTSELKRDRQTATAADHGPHYILDARFDQAFMANGQTVDHLAAHAESDNGVIRQAQVSLGPNHQTTLTIAPAIDGRTLRIDSDQAGTLLLATNTLPDIRGGTMTLSGRYDDTKPYHPLSGTATVTKFRMSDAPAIAKLLQALTGYGLFGLAQGPGLAITTMQTSFTYQQNIVTLENALAHSASIGFTADGTFDTATSEMNFHGTIVPAYIFNNALSHLPLIGKLFSPEPGGGVLAATFSMTGPHGNPTVRVNPLSALTPGFLRGIFGGIT